MENVGGAFNSSAHSNKIYSSIWAQSLFIQKVGDIHDVLDRNLPIKKILSINKADLKLIVTDPYSTESKKIIDNLIARENLIKNTNETIKVMKAGAFFKKNGIKKPVMYYKKAEMQKAMSVGNLDHLRDLAAEGLAEIGPEFNFELVRFMLKNNASVSHLLVVTAAGIDINATNSKNNTNLSECARKGQINELKKLIEAGANYLTELETFSASDSKKHEKVSATLIKAGA